MTEHPTHNTDAPLLGDAPRFDDHRPSRLLRWAAPAALLVSRRAASAAEIAYGAARARGTTRQIAANAAFKSLTGENRPIYDDGDAERDRQLVDAGHGAPPMRASGPATEMDLALGALSSPRNAAHSNADTYVVVLCVLAFASLALLGFYPIYSALKGDAAAEPTHAIACEKDGGSVTAPRGVKLKTTCR